MTTFQIIGLIAVAVLGIYIFYCLYGLGKFNKKKERRRKNKVLTVALLILTAIAGEKNAMAQWTGAGTQQNPYQIKSIADMNTLATNVNSGTGYSGTYFLLTTDLTYTYTYAWNSTDYYASENNFTAIGAYGNSFKGHFDGGGHTISGIRIYKNGTTNADQLQGVFGNLSGGSVRNLTVADASITGYQQVGAIAGCNNGTIEDCVVASNVGIYRVADNASKHGGVVGANSNGNVRRCTSSATVKSHPKFANTISAICGGIIGYQSQSQAVNHYVEDNVALNVVVISGQSVGGAIIGKIDSGNINYLHLNHNYYRNCTINGSVNATNVGLGNPAGDMNGARSVHALTLGTNITATGESVVIGNTTYYASNTTVTLGHNNSTGYLVTYRLNGNALGGNTFTMPNNDNGTVSATLTPITYYVHFDKNNDGASGTMSDQQFTYGQAQNLTANTFSRTGYDFIGWSTTFNGEAEYTDGQSVSNLTAEDGQTVTLYAKWNIINYNITYNLDGGSVVTENPTTYNIETPTFSLNNPTQPGYTFDGWTGTGLNEATQTVTIAQGSTGDRSYTANWTPNTYTVHFDANNGEGSMDDMNFTYDVAQNLTPNTFTREDYSFLGWNTQANGSGASYTDGQSVSNLTTEPNGTVNLYAKWRLKSWQGSGTEDDPYIISSTAALDLLAYAVNNNIDNNNGFANKYFLQTEDFTYNGTTNNYTPIGNASCKFRGHFDGGGFSISGINVTGSDDYIGVFGYVYYGSVENIVLANTTFTGTNYVGGIAGYTLKGSISNCKVMGNVTIGTPTSSSSYHGGIVGYLNQTELSGCLSMATLTDPNDVGSSYGGIAGLNSNGTINNCMYAGGSVTAHNNTAAIAQRNSLSSAFSNNYYYNCTVNGVTTGVGVVGYDAGDIDGAQPAHTITLGENVALAGDQTTYNVSGLTAIGTTVLIHTVGSTSTILSGAMQTVTLTYTGTMPEGYSLVYNDGADHPTIGNAFMMPDANVTVSISNAFPTIPGMGTEDNPFVISSKEQLDILADMVNIGYSFTNKYFKLGADINYNPNELTNGGNYTAIGFFYSSESNYCFNGTFDGDGHIISGIRINQPVYNPQALFGCVGPNGTVKNVTLDDAVIIGSQSVGGIAGDNRGTVENCRVINCNITGQTWVGGIAGYNQCENTENCLVLNTSITYSDTDNHMGGAVIGVQLTGGIRNNYYHNCTVNGAASNIGCGFGPDNILGWVIGDITMNNGAMPAYTLTLGAHITATPAPNVTFNNIDYYTAGTEVTLGTNPPAYTITSATLTYGGNNYNIASVGGVYSFTMPAADATVTAQINIPAGLVESITVTPDEIYPTVGATYSIVFTVLPADATNKAVTFTSSDETVATVNENGTVTAVSAGTATITIAATDGSGVTGTLTVNVMNIDVEEIIGYNEYITISTGETATINYQILPEQATDKSVSFTSANTAIATVDENGKVTGVGMGVTTITIASVQNPEVTASVEVIVDLFPYGDQFTKGINGYGNDDNPGGWYLIASPVSAPITPTEGNGFLANTYDLYRFNQSGTNGEWENYKAHNEGFVLENGKGYLYANSENVPITFVGTPYSGDGTVTLDKDDNATLSGWNLVGNPFTANAYIDRSFYIMNDEGSEIIAATSVDRDYIKPMEGIFVHTDEDGETMTFTTNEPSKGRGQKPEQEQIVIDLHSQLSSPVIDRAIVCFDEGCQLPKLQIFENSSKLYIPQDGKDYAIVSADGRSEIPVNFKAKKNGEYTLTVTESLNSQLTSLRTSSFSTLNLIDNLTGANINLLVTPSYTFTAKTTDYASRFKLVFNANGAEDNNDFAFIDGNGNIIINGSGMVQIIDMLGRVLVTRDANNLIGTQGLVGGVYVLRLVNGDHVKTQKIVVR